MTDEGREGADRYAPPMRAKRVSRRGAAFAVLTVLVIALEACGGGASTADMKTVGKAALADSHMKISTAIEVCVGRSLIDDLGRDDAVKTVKQSDISKMPKAQRTAAIAAFDRCVPSSAFAATFVAQLPTGSTSTALEACLTQQFRGKVGTVAAAISDPKSDAVTTKRFDKCPTHEVAVQALQSGLSSGGVSADVANCVIAQLPELKLSDVVMQSKSLETQVEQAAKSCQAGK
jgi:hypothetical protein